MRMRFLTSRQTIESVKTNWCRAVVIYAISMTCTLFTILYMALFLEADSKTDSEQKIEEKLAEATTLLLVKVFSIVFFSFCIW